MFTFVVLAVVSYLILTLLGMPLPWSVWFALSFGFIGGVVIHKIKNGDVSNGNQLTKD